MALSRRAIVERLRNGQVGLVLCGGGFKRAYQIGVWKALKKLGIERFECIAGTSAGALNAILIADGSVKKAEDLWKDFLGLGMTPRWTLAYLGGYMLTVGPVIGAIFCWFLSVLAMFAGLSPWVWGLPLGLVPFFALAGSVSLTVVSFKAIWRRVFFTEGSHETVFALAILSFVFAFIPLFAGPAGSPRYSRKLQTLRGWSQGAAVRPSIANAA